MAFTVVVIISAIHGIWRFNSFLDELHKSNHNTIRNTSKIIDRLFFLDADASFSVIYAAIIDSNFLRKHREQNVNLLAIATVSARKIKRVIIKSIDGNNFSIPDNNSLGDDDINSLPQWRSILLDANEPTMYSSIYHDKRSGEKTAFVSKANFDASGHFSGVISAELDVRGLQKLMGNFITRTESSFFIVDRDGNSLSPELNEGHDIIKIIAEQPNPTNGYFKLNGYMYYYAELPISTWFVVLKTVVRDEEQYSISLSFNNYVFYMMLFLVISILWLACSKFSSLERARLVASLHSGKIISDNSIKDVYSAIEERQVELIQANERAQKDALTSLWNRSRLEHDLAALTKNNTPYIFVITDIDNFKSINDRYGHQVGDNVLRVNAKIGESIISEDGTLYRYGGEEFVAIFINSTKDEVAYIIDAWRKQLYTREWREFSLKEVSFSAGIVSGSYDPEAVIHKADELLYQAKADGKNQSVIES